MRIVDFVFAFLASGVVVHCGSSDAPAAGDTQGASTIKSPTGKPAADASTCVDSDGATYGDVSAQACALFAPAQPQSGVEPLDAQCRDRQTSLKGAMFQRFIDCLTTQERAGENVTSDTMDQCTDDTVKTACATPAGQDTCKQVADLTAMSDAELPQCAAIASGLNSEGQRILLSCLSQRGSASALNAGVDPIRLVASCAGGLAAN